MFYRGDDLTTFWGLFALALPFAFEARREKGWRRTIFWALTVALCLCAVFWWLIKEYAPPVASFVTARATNGESWFILFMFVMALIAMSGKNINREAQNESSFATEQKKSFADKVTISLAGKVNYLTEYALRRRFVFPLGYNSTEAMYFRELMNSTHIIWTEEEPKELRRKFDTAFQDLAYAYKGTQSLAAPVAQQKELEVITEQLVAVLMARSPPV